METLYSFAHQQARCLDAITLFKTFFYCLENTQAQMLAASDSALMNGGMMVEGGLGPTTVMGQIMGALNTGLSEDLNIEALEHGFDCNVDEVRRIILPQIHCLLTISRIISELLACTVNN